MTAQGSPVLRLRLLGRQADRGFAAPLADGLLVSDLPLDPATRSDEEHTGAPSVPAIWPRSGWTPLYRGPGLVEGRLQEILAEVRGGLRRLTYDDGERWVAAEDGWIARVPLPGEPAARAARSWARALGAPTALVLTGRAVYLLHASAVAGPRGAIALVAPSGGGKSTLAAAAERYPEVGLRRIADDQFPVRLGAEPVALPRFPQLKLAATRWVGMEEEAAVPLAAVVEIAHAPGAGRPEAIRLDPAAACLALVRATVATRLFTAGRLAEHLAAAAAAAEILPVFRLRFASGREGLEPALSTLLDLT